MWVYFISYYAIWFSAQKNPNPCKGHASRRLIDRKPFDEEKKGAGV
jgi:hypothetical protein